jgi:hypothetical protein
MHAKRGEKIRGKREIGRSVGAWKQGAETIISHFHATSRWICHVTPLSLSCSVGTEMNKNHVWKMGWNMERGAISVAKRRTRRDCASNTERKILLLFPWRTVKCYLRVPVLLTKAGQFGLRPCQIPIYPVAQSSILSTIMPWNLQCSILTDSMKHFSNLRWNKRKSFTRFIS